jgi:hypothetical protein
VKAIDLLSGRLPIFSCNGGKKSSPRLVLPAEGFGRTSMLSCLRAFSLAVRRLPLLLSPYLHPEAFVYIGRVPKEMRMRCRCAVHPADHACSTQVCFDFPHAKTVRSVCSMPILGEANRHIGFVGIRKQHRAKVCYGSLICCKLGLILQTKPKLPNFIHACFISS